MNLIASTCAYCGNEAYFWGYCDEHTDWKLTTALFFLLAAPFVGLLLVRVVCLIWYKTHPEAYAEMLKKERKRKQEAEEKRRQDEVANTFVCTKCGARVMYPEEVGGGLGCGVWIVLILLSVVCGFFAAILWVLVAITVVAAAISFYGVRKRVCPSCGSTSTLIPISSPEGKRIVEKSNQSETEQMESSSGTIEQRLKRLAELKDKCIISNEEYEVQRKKILDTI